jgi:hypothetical protein
MCRFIPALSVPFIPQGQCPHQKIDCTGRRARDIHSRRDSASSPA